MYSFVFANDNTWGYIVNTSEYKVAYDKRFMLFIARKTCDITITIMNSYGINYKLLRYYKDKISKVNIVTNSVNDKDYLGVASIFLDDCSEINNLLYDEKFDEIIPYLQNNIKGVTFRGEKRELLL